MEEKRRMSAKIKAKELKTLPTMRDFLKSYLEDVTRLPTTRQPEFCFHLIFGATPVEELHIDQPQPGTQELTTQFQEL